MRQSLAGGWTLSRDDSNQSWNASLPGDNLSALFEHGVVADPYFGMNELDLQWLGRVNWRYTGSVSPAPELLEKKYHYVHLESVDTVSRVSINGAEVAAQENMFHPVRADITGRLRDGDNELSIALEAPETRAIEKAASLPYPVPHQYYPVQSPHRNLLRKVQCHSGWDWGPALMVSGVYGDMYLGGTDRERIESVRLFATPAPPSGGELTGAAHAAGEGGIGRWSVDCSVELYAYEAGAATVTASLTDQEETVGKTDLTVELSEGLNVVSLVVEVENPKLWWPNGYGEQPLYEATVTTDNDRWNGSAGFRILELLSEEDENGRGMVFRLNGQEIFAKGANWIPSDAMPGRQSDEVITRLLQDAATANMNMIRVWGGGQYESEHFYNECDRLGILVWQDFMFSCSLYPSDPAFLASVRSEVAYQVKRLHHHPSVALWCGNNENVGALTWYEVSVKNRDRYIIDYDRLNEGAVGSVVRDLDPSRPWWPSSPAAGPGDFSDNWHDDSRGDMHYWSVWHEGKPFEAYYEVTPRFCSEFGFQSYPSPESVADFAPLEERNVTSPIMDHHQRHPRGNEVIVSTIGRYFRFPSRLEDFIYLSQVQQAMAIATAVEYWRSRRPVSMGALYWQLNDLWPVASWSSIEYSGRWKLLHYAAKRFFRPVHLVLIPAEDDHTEAYLLNDTGKPVEGTLTYRLRRFDGTVISEEAQRLSIAPESSVLTATVPPPAAAEKPPVADELHLPASRGDYFLEAVFEPAPGASPAEPIDAVRLSDLPKRCAVEQPRLTVTSAESADGVEIRLESDRPAFFVALEVPDPLVRFSDNDFHLMPDRPQRLLVTDSHGHGASWFSENLTVRDLTGV